MTQDTKIEAVGHTDGGPAFPFGETEHSVVYPGMSLRDWFAGRAMPVIMERLWARAQDGDYQYEDTIYKIAAVAAYEAADAMLTERSKAEGRAS